MIKKIFYLLLIVFIILVVNGLINYRKYQTLITHQSITDEEITESKQICDELQPRAMDYVAEVQSKGTRATDPKTFSSPYLNRCLFTYLIIDPSLPDATTYNSYLIYDIETKKPVTLEDGKEIKIYSDYLKRISELEQRDTREFGTFFQFWYNTVTKQIILLKQYLWQK